jgi:hypothetical protein
MSYCRHCGALERTCCDSVVGLEHQSRCTGDVGNRSEMLRKTLETIKSKLETADYAPNQSETTYWTRERGVR